MGDVPLEAQHQMAVISQPTPYFHIFMSDRAPEGDAHTSPELRRARQAGLLAKAVRTPSQTAHKHIGHEVLIISHGAGNMFVGSARDEDAFPLTAGQILIIPGGNPHRFVITEHICVYGFEFSPDYFLPLAADNALAHRLSTPEDPLPARLFHDPAALQSLQNIFEEVLASRSHADEFDAPVQHAYGSLVAIAMLRLLRQEMAILDDHPTNLRVLAVKSWIDRHLFETVMLAELAQMANLSISRFCTIFRELVGVSPKHYRLTRRLQHAATLLVDSSYSLSSIARMVGFSDLASFHHAFKQLYQVSPTAYRKNGNDASACK